MNSSWNTTEFEDQLRGRWDERQQVAMFKTLTDIVRNRAALAPGEELNFDLVHSPRHEVLMKAEVRGEYVRGRKLVGSHTMEVSIGNDYISQTRILNRILEAMDYLVIVVRSFPGPKQRIQRWRGSRR